MTCERGFNTAQAKPKTEPMYLARRSLMAIAQSIWRLLKSFLVKSSRIRILFFIPCLQLTWIRLSLCFSSKIEKTERHSPIIEKKMSETKERAIRYARVRCPFRHAAGKRLPKRVHELNNSTAQELWSRGLFIL